MRIFVAILIALVLALGTANADANCKTTEPTVGAGGIYVINDLCQPDCLFSVWVYHETNGQPGLQRCDDEVDPCCGPEGGDRLIV